MENKKGFTLIELLIVIGIIAVLMAMAIVAINPARQFAKANNARRWGDVNAFANAIAIRIIEAKGSWDLTGTCEDLTAITGGPFDLAEDTADPTDVDICDCLVPDYFGILPVDPSDPSTYYFNDCSDYYTGYQITRDASSGRVKISAPIIDDEGASTPAEISVSR